MNEQNVDTFTLLKKTEEEVLAERAGLATGGLDENGDRLWVGTSDQWGEFKKLLEVKSGIRKLVVKEEMEERAEIIQDQEFKWGEPRI